MPAESSEESFEERFARYEDALRRIEQRRESWYDAMGDDQAGLPSDEAEAAWNIAIAALEPVKQSSRQGRS